MRYRPDIDGLRAVAVVPVILFHTGVEVFSGGYVGVDVFFVISGYVITESLLNDLRENRFSILSFYERRVRRIFPALFVTIAASWIAAYFMFLPDAMKSFSQSVAATSAFVSNVYFWKTSGYFQESALTMPLLHTWSLSIEEQYYIFIPVILYLCYRFVRQPWAFIFLPATLASLALSIIALGSAPTATFFLLPTRAWELLIGALLALMPLPPLSSTRSAQFLSAAGLAAIAYAIFAFTDETAFPGANALFPCLGAAALIYAGRDQAPLLSRLLSTAPVVFIGKISYSLYLVHWPLIVFTRYYLLRPPTPLEIVLLTLASLVLATLSWRFIEQPFRRRSVGLGQWVVPRRGLAAMIVAALVGAVGWQTSGFAARYPNYVEKIEDGRSEWKVGSCFFEPDQPWTSWTIENCQRTNGAGELVLLWGDSYASHYIPGLLRSAEARNRRLVQYTSAGCPPILGYASMARPHCHDFNQNALAIIRDFHIKKVILAAHWSQSLRHGLGGLQETLDAIAKLDSKVVVVGQSPEFPVSATVLNFRQIGNRAGATALAQTATDPTVNDRLREMAGKDSFIDPLTTWCNGELCPYKKGNDLYYFDEGHLTTVGSAEAVRTYFDRALTTTSQVALAAPDATGR